MNLGVGLILKMTQEVLNSVLAAETSGASGSIWSYSKRVRELKIRSPVEACPTWTDVSKLGQKSQFHLC